MSSSAGYREWGSIAAGVRRSSLEQLVVFILHSSNIQYPPAVSLFIKESLLSIHITITLSLIDIIVPVRIDQSSALSSEARQPTTFPSRVDIVISYRPHFFTNPS